MQRKSGKAAQASPDAEDLLRIPARDAEIGRTYCSRTGLRIVVKGRRGEWVVVHSLTTSHDVEIPPSYMLSEDSSEENGAHTLSQ